MNLFNKKYHIQIYMRRLQLEKNKNKKNKQTREVQEGFYGKTIGEYMYVFKF